MSGPPSGSSRAGQCGDGVLPGQQHRRRRPGRDGRARSGGGALIVDWDVHHGNGTQALFWEDPQVGFFSIHRWPFYPGTGLAGETGSGAGLGTTLNRPIEFGTSRKAYLDAFRSGLETLAARMRPQLVLVSAGFDSHRDDPIGSLGLEVEDFAELTASVVDIANEFAGGRLVSVLEGDTTRRSWRDASNCTCAGCSRPTCADRLPLLGARRCTAGAGAVRRSCRGRKNCRHRPPRGARETARRICRRRRCVSFCGLRRNDATIRQLRRACAVVRLACSVTFAAARRRDRERLRGGF